MQLHTPLNYAPEDLDVRAHQIGCPESERDFAAEREAAAEEGVDPPAPRTEFFVAERPKAANQRPATIHVGRCVECGGFQHMAVIPLPEDA